MEFEIEQLARSFDLDIDEAADLESFVLSARRLERELFRIVSELAVATVGFESGIRAERFHSVLMSKGFPDDDAWSRLDDIEELADSSRIHDLLVLIGAIAHSAETGVEDPSIHVLSKILKLKLA